MGSRRWADDDAIILTADGLGVEAKRAALARIKRAAYAAGVEAGAKVCDELDDWRRCDRELGASVSPTSAAAGAALCAEKIRALLAEEGGEDE